jgi:hypothetical protein
VAAADFDKGRAQGYTMGTLIALYVAAKARSLTYRKLT